MESSRKNTTNLRLSIGPLSSISPLEPNDSSTTDHDTSPQWHRHTYISGKSAPTTPGILSRSGSTTRLNSKSFTHLAFTTDKLGGGAPLTKSKSTTVLQGQQQQHLPQRKKKLRYGGLTKAATLAADDGEWLFRAGAAITSEARESKGQSWLVSRESSTSLVALDDDEDTGYDGTQDKAAFSPRYSRSASRAASAKTSRRPSGVGSRPDLTFFTPLASRTPVREMLGGHHDYFGDMRDAAVVAGPDFVDEQDEEDEGSDADEELNERLAEAEVARLAQNKGFGLGGLVDRLIGWTLFDVGEEGREREEEEEEMEMPDVKPRSTAQARQADVPVTQKARNAESIAATTAAKSAGGAEDVEGQDADGQGGWSDAAWLLSVASKVLL